MTKPTRRTSPARNGRAAKRIAAPKSKTPKSKAAKSKTLKSRTPTTTAGRALRGKLARAKRAADIANVSAQTIAHRGVMIGRELAAPTGFADPEFARMGREKVLAAGEAGNAMLWRFAGGHRVWTDFWFQQLRRSFSVLPQIAASRSPVHLAQIVAHSGGTLMSDCFALWAKAANLSEAVADAGARPIHRVAAANARRLGRAA